MLVGNQRGQRVATGGQADQDSRISHLQQLGLIRHQPVQKMLNKDLDPIDQGHRELLCVEAACLPQLL